MFRGFWPPFEDPPQPSPVEEPLLDPTETAAADEPATANENDPAAADDTTARAAPVPAPTPAPAPAPPIDPDHLIRDIEQELDISLEPSSSWSRPSSMTLELCEHLRTSRIKTLRLILTTITMDDAKLLTKALLQSPPNSLKRLLVYSLEKKNDHPMMVRLLSKGLEHHRESITNVFLKLSRCSDRERAFLFAAVLGPRVTKLQFEASSNTERLFGDSVDSPGGDAFLSFMQTTHALKELYYRGAERSAAARDPSANMAIFAKAIRSNTSLEKLSAHSISCRDDINVKHLLESLALRPHPTLVNAEFVNFVVALDDSGCSSSVGSNNNRNKSLRLLQKESSPLETLTFRNCRFGQYHMGVLFGQSTQTTNLFQIILDDSYIGGDEGMAVLANSLSSKHPQYQLSLKRLSLNNVADNVTGILLADALKENGVLELLDIRGSTMQQPGITAFGNALKENDVLATLWFLETMHDLPLQGLTAMVEGLQQNKAIKSIRHEEYMQRKEDQTVDKAILNLLDAIDFLVLCNKNENYALKSTFEDQFPKTLFSPQLKTTTTTTTMAPCSVCGKDSNNGISCKEQQHFICIKCLESHFEQHLGEKTLACPVKKCSSVPFSVSDDLYGKVSAFHYEMHCKQQNQMELLTDISKQVNTLVAMRKK